MAKNKKTTLSVESELRDSMKLISQKSGINLERLTAEALKRFIADNEHFKKEAAK